MGEAAWASAASRRSATPVGHGVGDRPGSEGGEGSQTESRAGPPERSAGTPVGERDLCRRAGLADAVGGRQQPDRLIQRARVGALGGDEAPPAERSPAELGDLATRTALEPGTGGDVAQREALHVVLAGRHREPIDPRRGPLARVRVRQSDRRELGLQWSDEPFVAGVGDRLLEHGRSGGSAPVQERGSCEQ